MVSGLEIENERIGRKGEATREAVKLAARQAIARDGFASVKIADIMSLAGRSPGAFYKYFKSKEVLLHELLGDFNQQLREEVNLPLNPTGSPHDNLVIRVEAFWKVYRANWPIATAVFQMSMIDTEFARAWNDVRQQGIRVMSGLITMAKKEGYSQDLDTQLSASALCSMLEYTCYNWTARGGDFPDRFIDDKTALAVLTHLFSHALGWHSEGMPKPLKSTPA